MDEYQLLVFMFLFQHLFNYMIIFPNSIVKQITAINKA